MTHWKKQLKYSNKFLESRYRREFKNTIRGEKGFDLDDVSPAKNVEKLTRPLLIGHGANDNVVPKSQFDMMIKAAKKQGVEIETKLYGNGNHHLSKRKNEVDWLERLSAFLKKHNPAD